MRTVIITGGNSGLGFETAKKIAKNKEYRVILACRNQEKAEEAFRKIKDETGNDNILSMRLDTASLTSVREFVAGYESRNIGKVYALLLNAGINGMHTGTTEDGMEIVFQTNHLGHFLLANLMLPYMESYGKIFATCMIHRWEKWYGREQKHLRIRLKMEKHPAFVIPSQSSVICTLFMNWQEDWKKQVVIFMSTHSIRDLCRPILHRWIKPAPQW